MVTANIRVKASLYLSSYFPLWIILLVMNVAKHPELFKQNPTSFPILLGIIEANWSTLLITGILVFLAFYPVVKVRSYLKDTFQSVKPERIAIQSIEDMTSEYLLYVVSYVFPFMTAGTFDVFGAIALVGAMITIGTLYIKANLFHVNPMLLLLYNYRLYKIIDAKGNTRHLFSGEESLLRNQPMDVLSFHGVLYVEQKREPRPMTTGIEA